MRPKMEAPEDLIRRITEANRCVPLERLALSPQCGLPQPVREFLVAGTFPIRLCKP
jgi:methionine synthase II (cobalamin-independent)